MHILRANAASGKDLHIKRCKCSIKRGKYIQQEKKSLKMCRQVVGDSERKELNGWIFEKMNTKNEKGNLNDIT